MKLKNILSVHRGCPYSVDSVTTVVFHNLKHMFEPEKRIWILEPTTVLPDIDRLRYAFRSYGEIFCPSGMLGHIMFNFIRSKHHFEAYIESFFR